MTSFDGHKTLDFDRDHNVDLTEQDTPDDEKSKKSERKSFGSWSYDEEHKRFSRLRPSGFDP
jgi:hypothetical protein